MHDSLYEDPVSTHPAHGALPTTQAVVSRPSTAHAAEDRTAPPDMPQSMGAAFDMAEGTAAAAVAEALAVVTAGGAVTTAGHGTAVVGNAADNGASSVASSVRVMQGADVEASGTAEGPTAASASIARQTSAEAALAIRHQYDVDAVDAAQAIRQQHATGDAVDAEDPVQGNSTEATDFSTEATYVSTGGADAKANEARRLHLSQLELRLELQENTTGLDLDGAEDVGELTRLLAILPTFARKHPAVVERESRSPSPLPSSYLLLLRPSVPTFGSPALFLVMSVQVEIT